MVENKDPLLLRNVTVLIADDDPLITEVYEKQVKLCGGHAITARDGDEVFEKLRHAKADVILLDIKMPKANGYEVLRQLKNDERAKDATVFILTSLEPHPEYVEKATDMKIEGFLIKSDVTPKAVMEKIAEALSRKETGIKENA